MTTIVLPRSRKRCNTRRSCSTSKKCSPVVGSSRMYRVRPVSRLESSRESLTRWASPPDKVVALCPNRTYPSPTSNRVSRRRASIGIASKKFSRVFDG